MQRRLWTEDLWSQRHVRCRTGLSLTLLLSITAAAAADDDDIYTNTPTYIWTIFQYRLEYTTESFGARSMIII